MFRPLPSMKRTQLRCTRGGTLENLGLIAYALPGQLENKLQVQHHISVQHRSFEHLIANRPSSAPRQISLLNHF